MALSSFLFKRVPATLPLNFCPTSWQELVNAIDNGGQVVLQSDVANSFFNFGSTKPTPENRIYPWLNTQDGRWYFFENGLWLSFYSPEAGPNGLRWEFEGAEAGVWSFDGGDGVDPSVTPPTTTTGALWEVDHNYDGRMGIGPGTLTDSGTVVSVGSTGGSDEKTLTPGAVPAHQHIVPIAVRTSIVTDPAPGGTPGCAKYGTGALIGAGNVVDDSAGTYSDRGFPLTSQFASETTVTPPDKQDIMPPYRGLWKIKRTSRVWLTIAP